MVRIEIFYSNVRWALKIGVINARKVFVPYVIRENVLLGIFHILVQKNLNHTSCIINAMQMI